MTTIAQQVLEFHQTYGHAWRTEPTGDGPEGPFRVRLQDEEIKETVEGLRKGDLIEVADGLTDVAYVTYGSAHTFGIDLDAAVERVAPSLPALAEHPSLDSMEGHEAVYALARYGETFSDAVLGRQGLTAITVALVGCQVSLRRAALAFGLDIEALVAEVHRSNMTKIPNGKDKPLKVPGIFSEPDLPSVIFAGRAPVA